MIVAIATIEREAREAFAAGKTIAACPWPDTTPAGRAWIEAYEAAALAQARRLYDIAIAESSCIN